MLPLIPVTVPTPRPFVPHPDLAPFPWWEIVPSPGPHFTWAMRDNTARAPDMFATIAEQTVTYGGSS